MAAEMADQDNRPAQRSMLSKEEEEALADGYGKMEAEAGRPFVVLVSADAVMPKSLQAYSAALLDLRDVPKLAQRFTVRPVTTPAPPEEALDADLQVVLAAGDRVYAPAGLERTPVQPVVFVQGKRPAGAVHLEDSYALPASPSLFAGRLATALLSWDGESKLRFDSLFERPTAAPAATRGANARKAVARGDKALGARGEGPRRESFLVEVESDQPARKDLLGFQPYVQALARFLAAPGTSPPLTVSIEGEWGTGKSSFMLQLEDELRLQDELKDEQGRVFVVRFNPWRYDRGESLWAAFALHFIGALESQLTRWERLRARLALGWNRTGRGRRPATRDDAGAAIAWLAGGLAIALAVPALGVLLLPAGLLSSLVGAAGIVSGVAIAGFQALKPAFNAASRVRRRLKKEIRSPDYAERAAFIEQFHTDLKHIVEAYVTAPRIFVFVEDLDRCDVPRAAELMQAINLLIADDPRIVFLLGMDREKVAAGIAVRHRDLLPFMQAAPEGPALRGAGLVYGYTFIEKFIQVPFAIPVPTEVEIDRMLRRGKTAAAASNAVVDPNESVPASTARPARGDGRTLPAPSWQAGEPVDPASRERRSAIEVGFEADSAAVVALAVQLAPVFDNNPRRVKQFVNLFRLRGLIATRTGLFDVPPKQAEGLSPEQLGKFVALSIRFPLLLDDLRAERGLLADLQGWALRPAADPKDGNERSARFLRWTAEPDLAKLLAVGHGRQASPRHDMRRVDVERLLRVSPAVASEAAAAKTRSAGGARLDPEGAQEAYRAHLGRMLQEGPLGPEEEASLARLRRELALGEADAAVVRAEVERALAPKAAA